MNRLRDRNDVDQYGMDADTRKRLNIKRNLDVRKKNTSLRQRRYKRKSDALEERVVFQTLGARGNGSADHVGYVTSVFFHSTPEFERSLVDIQRKRNGWVLQGAWPSSGKAQFDWEFDIFGEGRGSVVVRFNMWDSKGRNEWQAYRATVATAKKMAQKFLKKTFFPMKQRMVKKAKHITAEDYLFMLEMLSDDLEYSIEEASKLTPYQKAQRGRRQTIALHTKNPAKQSAFYKHAVRAIFNKLKKSGEGFRGAAKGGQLIAQWMMKKYGYSHGSHETDNEDPSNIGKMRLTSKGIRRNRKHTSEPASVRARKERAYDHIIGIQRKSRAKQQQVSKKSLGAG